VSEAQLSQQAVSKESFATFLRPEEESRSITRAACEASIPPVLVLLMVFFVPVGNSWFPLVAAVLSVFVVGYAVIGLIVLKDSSRRWQLTPPWWADGKHYAYGFLFVATLFVAGLGPIFAIRYLQVPMPNPGSPWRYFAWCVIQDFVFFSLVLRGLVDLINPYVAIGITAILFGFSHFPNYELICGTILTALAWGYLFLASRWLLFVVISHWAMGLLLLTRM
jgi:membrane protease YdiL (CAAX protease family)